MLENERLLVSLLPASGAAHVREGNADVRQSFADVTVAFINLVGFESLSPELGEDASMALLSDVVAACDEAAEHAGRGESPHHRLLVPGRLGIVS